MTYQILEDQPSLCETVNASGASAMVLSLVGSPGNPVSACRVLQRALAAPPECVTWFTFALYEEDDVTTRYPSPDFSHLWANGKDGGSSLRDAFAFTPSLDKARRLAAWYSTEGGMHCEIRQPVFGPDGKSVRLVPRLRYLLGQEPLQLSQPVCA